MAKITDLPEAETITGDETVTIVQDGKTRQSPLLDLLSATQVLVAVSRAKTNNSTTNRFGFGSHVYVGTDIEAGLLLTSHKIEMAVAATAATIRYRLWERPLTASNLDAPGAGFADKLLLDLSHPIANYPTLVPDGVAEITVPYGATIIAKEGFALGYEVWAVNADGVRVEMGTGLSLGTYSEKARQTWLRPTDDTWTAASGQTIAGTFYHNSTPGSRDLSSAVQNARIAASEVALQDIDSSLSTVIAESTVHHGTLSLLTISKSIGPSGDLGTGTDSSANTNVYAKPVEATSALDSIDVYVKSPGTIKLRAFSKSGDVFTMVGGPIVVDLPKIGAHRIPVGGLTLKAGEFIGLTASAIGVLAYTSETGNDWAFYQGTGDVDTFPDNASANAIKLQVRFNVREVATPPVVTQVQSKVAELWGLVTEPVSIGTQGDLTAGLQSSANTNVYAATLPRKAVLDSVDVYVRAPGVMKLKVFRKTGDNFAMVGQPLQIALATTGAQTISLAGVVLEPGDHIGFTGSAVGVLSYLAQTSEFGGFYQGTGDVTEFVDATSSNSVDLQVRFNFNMVADANTPVARGNVDWPEDLTKFAIFGSSTAMYLAPYVKDMAANFGASDFLNGGDGSGTMQTLAAQMGVIPALVTVTSGIIPATTTPENITISNVPINNGMDPFVAVLGGVAGTIACVSGQFRFTRIAAGPAVTLAGEHEAEPVIPPRYRGAPWLINVGKNNMGGSTVEQIMAFTKRIHDFNAARIKRVIVMGHFVNPDGSNKAKIDAYNALAAAEYGARFYDVSAYILSPEVWTDTGISPTADDLAAQSAGKLALSLSDGGVHMNATTNAAVKVKLQQRIASLGWYI